MAKKKEQVDYASLERELKAGEPGRLYMLRGEEDYLRDKYLGVLRSLCVPEGLDSFNYHRLQGPKLNLRELSDAIEAMPFMGERSLVEIRDFDINRTGDYDGAEFAAMLADIPAWATVVFVFASGYAPDGRIAPVKAMKKLGVDVEFTAQGESALMNWVIAHFRNNGKDCDRETASHMLYVCGPLMNTLLPEIAKVSGHAQGPAVTKGDIDAVAERQPDTVVFDMTDALGEGQYDKAARMLSELLADRDENVPKLLYMISEQMRRLYAARIAPEGDKRGYLMECIPELSRSAFLIPKLVRASSNFSVKRLARAVSLCADCEFATRDGGAEAEERLKELILRLAMDENDA